jgi:predicted ATP-dependent Lon-type protease
MNKEQYIKRIEAIKISEEALRQDREDAANSHIRGQGVFQVGDAIWYVNHKKERHPGVISGVRVASYSNNIEYRAVKLKKDGAPSQHTLGFWNYADKFEKRG